MSASSPIKFKTRTGSIYSYDPQTKEWARLSSTADSGEIRTESGICIDDASVDVGLSTLFVMEPLIPDTSFRMVRTSTVVEIL